MSELKRIQLTTVQTPEQGKKSKRKSKTFRFELSLGESNAVTCPEYSFAELIKNEKPAVSDDPFDDGVDEAEVAAIAQRFEAKYGPKSAYSGKKKRTREMDDFYDLGDGYDVDDPFIDNTEAYDEVIPSSMTTKHGGFYINQGQLDFRSLSDDSLQAFTSPRPKPVEKKKKKGVIESDSEEETGELLVKKIKAMKRKKLLESKALEKKKKKLSDGSVGETLVKKKKKKNPQKLMKKMSKQRGSTGDQVIPSSPGNILTPTTTTTTSTSELPGSTTSSIPATTSGSSSIGNRGDAAAAAATASLVTAEGTGSTTTTAAVSASQQAVATTTTTSTTSPSARETVTNGTAESKRDSVAQSGVEAEEEKYLAILQEAMRDESSSKSGDETKGEQQPGDKNTQLPPQLPAELLNSIESIKKYAKQSTERKCKFFSPEINKLLLDIELGSYGLAWGSRTAIFCHLAEYFPCGKPALQRRAKKLRELQEEDQLQAPLQRLKKAIDAVMPAQQEQHRQEVLKAKTEAEKTSAADGPKEEASTESDEDETKPDTASKKPKRPRRKFQWTKETKQYLLEIVTLKMKSYKSRNQTAEDYIKVFLDAVVRPLWPQGWMQTRILLKESRMCHEDLAKAGGAQQNKEKTVPGAKPSAAVFPDKGATTPSSLDTNQQKPHVSKTEDVIEISSHSNEPKVSNKDVEPKAASTGSDTVVVHLPGSSASTPSSQPVAPNSNFPKPSPPPVEVIDITDSPSKPALLPSSASYLPASSMNKFSTVQKQGQQPQLLKSAQHLLQQQQQSTNSLSSSISGPPGLPPSVPQSKSGAAKTGGATVPGRANSVDPVYQAKVVLKPVSLLRGQQQKTVGSGGSKPLSAAASLAGSTTKSGHLQLGGQTKPSHLPNTPPQQLGASKSPVSFNQGISKLVSPGQGVLGSGSKLHSQQQHAQQKKPQAALGGGAAGPVSQAGGGQQVRAGIVLGTSTSLLKAPFPYSQVGNKADCFEPYRPKHTALHASTGTPGSGKSVKTLPSSAGTLRPTEPLIGNPGSSRRSPIPSGRLGMFRGSQQGSDATSSARQAQHTSVGTVRPAAQVGGTVSSPSPPKRPFQPAEQPSPPSRGSNSHSPQQQVSPGEASAKTLFEQMQSQIRSQEAMEGQALKNLALARNLMGFSGPKASAQDKPLPKSVTPLTTKAEVVSPRPALVSASDSRGMSPSQPAVDKASVAKLHENLLRMRDSMGGGGKKGGPAQSYSVASAHLGVRQPVQSPMGLKVEPGPAGHPAAATATPMGRAQQHDFAKNEKNIFSEMQKSAEGLMKQVNKPLTATPVKLFKSGQSGKVKELTLCKDSASAEEKSGLVSRSLLKSKAAPLPEGNDVASRAWRGGNTADSKASEGESNVQNRQGQNLVQPKLPGLEHLFDPITHLHKGKGQGHSGSLSGQ